MKDFDALKDIWHGQEARPRLNYNEILQQVKRSKLTYARKLLFETLAIALVIAFFILVWVFKPFMMWTSHLSLFIIICCCFYYLSVQINHYRNISGSDSLFQEPGKYIQYLKSYKLRRYRLNTRNYTIYSCFTGAAFLLYFIEVYFVAPFWQTVTGAVFTLVWFVICYFMMRVYIKGEQEKLNDIIDQLEKLNKQFDGDN